MDDNFDEQIRESTRQRAIEKIRVGFREWGIEATEEKIKELYKLNATLQNYFLELYWKIVKGEIR